MLRAAGAAEAVPALLRHASGGCTGEQQIGPWGAEKHRLAPPRTSISIAGSRYVSPGRRLPAAASTCPWSGPLSPSNTAIPSLLYGSRVEGLMHALYKLV